VGRRGGPGPICRQLKAVRGEDFSGEDGSGELERLLEAAPCDETARRGGRSTCAGEGTAQRGACSGGAGLVACGGGAAGWQAGGAGRGVAGGDGTGVMVRAGGVMAMCQSEVASRGWGGVPGR
jgi:hypothetical protein